MFWAASPLFSQRFLPDPYAGAPTHRRSGGTDPLSSPLLSSPVASRPSRSARGATRLPDGHCADFRRVRSGRSLDGSQGGGSFSPGQENGQPFFRRHSRGAGGGRCWLRRLGTGAARKLRLREPVGKGGGTPGRPPYAGPEGVPAAAAADPLRSRSEGGSSAGSAGRPLSGPAEGGVPARLHIRHDAATLVARRREGGPRCARRARVPGLAPGRGRPTPEPLPAQSRPRAAPWGCVACWPRRALLACCRRAPQRCIGQPGA